LSTPTAVKVAEIAPWIHYSQVKTASLNWKSIPDLAASRNFTLWNISARQGMFLGRTPLPWKQQGIMNNEMTALL
jgi:hypothetical protein